jgi:hypothetical protein
VRTRTSIVLLIDCDDYEKIIKLWESYCDATIAKNQDPNFGFMDYLKDEGIDSKFPDMYEHSYFHKP